MARRRTRMKNNSGVYCACLTWMEVRKKYNDNEYECYCPTCKTTHRVMVFGGYIMVGDTQ